MNRAFQRYVCERKCCQIFVYESFHRRRPKWHFPLWKWGKKPPKPPLPLARRGPPSNTAMPRPTARTTPNHSSDGWGTVAHVRRIVPIGYSGAPQIRLQKYPFPWTDPQTQLRASSLGLGPLRPMMPNDIRIRYAVFPQCIGQTDRPTDRSSTEKVWRL